MQELLSFDDILLSPKFSFIKSRKDVDTSQFFLGLNLSTPILSSNMDTITEYQMAAAMALNGGVGALHRFQTIDQNVKDFHNTQDLIVNSNLYTGQYTKPIVSIGIGSNEIERALALYEAGATHFLIDVAHGAAMHVVEQYDRLLSLLDTEVQVIVGNFSDASGIEAFNYHVKSRRKPNAFKIGIGGGSLCTTRIVTGCGAPTLSSILDCSRTGAVLIADGGIRNSGDYSKALAAGATTVMLGGLLAGTEEAPGDPVWEPTQASIAKPKFKVYRGSASHESYNVQGKTSPHRSPEGESTLVPYKGPVKDVLQQLNSGLRSAMSYCNSSNLTEFRERAKMMRVTEAGAKESKPHGKIT